MTLESKVEAILFFKSEPVTAGWLSKVLGVKEGEIMDALRHLEEVLTDRGITLLWKDDAVMLGTAAEAGELIEKITKEELNKDLGKASLETLTVVLYRSPIIKSEIDYIRGVNSSFILRNLLIRGLVERIPNPDDKRTFLYRPTFELLSLLGVTKKEDLPEYQEVQEEIKKFREEFGKE